MFVRNKIPRYSSCPTPSSSSPSSPPLSPLYSRRQRTPPSPRSFLSPQSFHPISLNPPHLLPLRLSLSLFPLSHHRHAKPPSTRPVTYPRTPPTKRRTAVMAAVTESIKVVLMRLNCRRYCRPAAAPSPPPPESSIPSSRPSPWRRFNPPIPHLFYRVYIHSLSFSLFLGG